MIRDYMSRYSRISPFCTRTVAQASGLDNRSPTIFPSLAAPGCGLTAYQRCRGRLMMH